MNRVHVAKRNGGWAVTRTAWLMGLIPVQAVVYRAATFEDALQWAIECAGFYAAMSEWGASPVVDR